MSDNESEREQAESRPSTSDVDRKEREHRRRNKKGENDSDTSTRPTQSAEDETVEVDQEFIESNQQPDIPHIRLENASQLDVVQQVEKTPADSISITVPQMGLDSTTGYTAARMEETTPVNEGTNNVVVPQFTLGTGSRREARRLDNSQPEGIKRTHQVQVPQVTVESSHHIQPFETFLKAVPETATQVVKAEPEPATDEPRPEQETTAVIESDQAELTHLNHSESAEDWFTTEWPDPLELLFGSGGAGINSDNPMIVLVDDDELVGVIETVLKRLHREKVGGEPDLHKFSTAEQLADEERWISADGQIFTVELRSDKEWDAIKSEEKYQEEWRSICENRLDQLFAGQRFGAIVFNRSQIPGFDTAPLPFHHPPIVLKIDGGLPWRDLIQVFSRSDSSDIEWPVTFSQLFDPDVHGVAQDRWAEILQASDGKFEVATTSDEAASKKHYHLKVFVVKWLAEQLHEDSQEFTQYDDLAEIEDYREIENKIHSEDPIRDANKVRPDIKYESQVFEVETFFGEDDTSGVGAKLKQTVRKYESVEQPITDINIVVDNLASLLHLQELARFKRNHQYWEKEEQIEINLYTIDLEQEELVPMIEIVDRIIELSE